ncbi:MAG: hypothetical protein AAF721_10220 [Myxococcota bacterium]
MGRGHDRGFQRREWLAGASASALATGLTLGCDSAPAADAAPKAVPAEAQALLGELRPGAAVEQWTLVAVHPIRHGALPVVLSSAAGTSFQVDIFARDAKGPQGVANTETLSLFVANRGDGGTPTDEDQGLGAMALARALAKQAPKTSALPALSTFAERASQHPDGAFSVPLG